MTPKSGIHMIRDTAETSDFCFLQIGISSHISPQSDIAGLDACIFHKSIHAFESRSVASAPFT